MTLWLVKLRALLCSAASREMFNSSILCYEVLGFELINVNPVNL